MTPAAGAIQVVLKPVMIVLTGLVVVRMTTGTGRLVSWRRPLHNLGIGPMAFDAVKVSTVIERFISEPRVAVNCRRPRVGRVTEAAFLRRIEVIGVLTGCSYAVVAR